jgi:hypothetical protein
MRALHFPSNYRVFCFGLVVVVMGAMLSMATPPVHAQGLALLACNGHSSTTFSPGITNQVQNVTYVGDNTFACTPPLGNTELTGGTSDVSVSGAPLSCTSLFLPGPENRAVPYNWNDASESTITYTLATVETVGGDIVITETGSVTGGLYDGYPSVLVTTLFDGILNNCGTSRGQVSVAGQETLTILPL